MYQDEDERVLAGARRYFGCASLKALGVQIAVLKRPIPLFQRKAAATHRYADPKRKYSFGRRRVFISKLRRRTVLKSEERAVPKDREDAARNIVDSSAALGPLAIVAASCRAIEVYPARFEYDNFRLGTRIAASGEPSCALVVALSHAAATA
ncbi:hypothetical protein PY650_21660 [Rhizobium calliandrae]|uniref:Uncharacterized protein n=1 Tax=Rhizobium calliandrae TaxID=1312182 RepID=A0ABT7KHW6_9HYPH|nr:hypothetical protein [Rhizobium calliandrae]MDL2408205.1 hypothetical protein [Rhizobium calliandrae]